MTLCTAIRTSLTFSSLPRPLRSFCSVPSPQRGLLTFCFSATIRDGEGGSPLGHRMEGFEGGVGPSACLSLPPIILPSADFAAVSYLRQSVPLDVFSGMIDFPMQWLQDRSKRNEVGMD